MTEHHEGESPASSEDHEVNEPSRGGVLLGVDAPSPADGEARRALSPARVAVVIGSVIALVGLIDVAMAWWPLQFGELQWEFGTISRTFDGLPLATFGLGAVLGGLAARRERGVMSWLFAAVVTALLVILMALVVLYVMDAFAAWGTTSGAVRDTLKRAFVRTGLFAGIYLATYGWMSWMAIRMLRSRGKG